MTPLTPEPPIENNPSQITVHLNLFPNRKDKVSKVKNIEILGRSEEDSSSLFPLKEHSARGTTHSLDSLGSGIRKLEIRNSTPTVPIGFFSSALFQGQLNATENTDLPGTTLPTHTQNDNIEISKVKSEMPTDFVYAHTTVSIPIANTTDPFDRFPGLSRSTEAIRILYPMAGLTVSPSTVHTTQTHFEVTTAPTVRSSEEYLDYPTLMSGEMGPALNGMLLQSRPTLLQPVDVQNHFNSGTETMFITPTPVEPTYSEERNSESSEYRKILFPMNR